MNDKEIDMLVSPLEKYKEEICLCHGRGCTCFDGKPCLFLEHSIFDDTCGIDNVIFGIENQD